MKRFFFSLIALSAAAIGCTQSALLETPDFGGTEISFSPYTGRTPVTKATSVENEAGLAAAGGFHIVGLLTNSTGTSVYMDGQVKGTTATGTTPTTSWSYGVTQPNGTWQETKMYWPDATSSSSLSFVAYSQNAIAQYTTESGSKANLLQWSTTSGEEYTNFTYTVPTNVSEQIDLLVAPYQSGLNLTNNPSGEVSLTFHHMLSRIGFKVQSTHAIADRNITIKSLTFTGTMPVAGTIDVTDFTVTSTNTSPTPVLTPEDDYLTSDPVSYSFLKQDFTTPSSTNATQIKRNGAGDTAADQYMMIMPHTVTDDKIVVTYTVGNDGKTATVNLPTDLTFLPGRAYDFILKVSTSKISFEVAETDWNTTHDDISVNVKVKGTTTADIILTATEKQSVLGSLGVQYRPMPADPTAEWTGSDIKTATYSGTYPYYQSGTIALTGLTAYTEYQYRVYSEKNSNTTYHSEGSFRTMLNITVTQKTNDIKSDELTVIGAFTTPSGATVTEKGFYLVEGQSVPNENNMKLTIDPDTEFTATFNNLKPATNYTCRAYVIIEGFTHLSSVDYTKHTFTTAPVFSIGDTENTPDNEEPGEGEEGGNTQKPDGPPAASFDEEEGEDSDGDDIPDNEIII